MKFILGILGTIFGIIVLIFVLILIFVIIAFVKASKEVNESNKIKQQKRMEKEKQFDDMIKEATKKDKNAKEVHCKNCGGTGVPKNGACSYCGSEIK